MASQSVARSESIAAFIPELERLVACTDAAFRQHCTGTFNYGVTPVVVGQDNDGQLTLKFGTNRPTACVLTRADLRQRRA